MESERQVEPIEVSVVIPCLNEQDTLARCIEKARRAFREHSIAGEILVADNGSTDSSRTIAEREGARVVTVRESGYGSALMGGIAAARGRFVIIGDADDSYDFLEVPKIVEKLREVAMVAHRLWPLGLRPNNATRCTGSDACRFGVSDSLLQLFRQHSWDAPKMSSLITCLNCRCHKSNG